MACVFLWAAIGLARLRLPCHWLCKVVTLYLGAARLFGPGPIVARTLQKPFADDRILSAVRPSPRSLELSKQSFASSAIKRSPARRRLKKTLQNSQHYLQSLRGASVPGLVQQAGLQYSRVRASAPTAAAALHHLRKPFNYVLGQPVAAVACLAVEFA